MGWFFRETQPRQPTAAVSEISGQASAIPAPPGDDSEDLLKRMLALRGLPYEPDRTHDHYDYEQPLYDEDPGALDSAWQAVAPSLSPYGSRPRDAYTEATNNSRPDSAPQKPAVNPAKLARVKAQAYQEGYQKRAKEERDRRDKRQIAGLLTVFGLMVAPGTVAGVRAAAEPGSGTNMLTRFFDGGMAGYVHPAETFSWLADVLRGKPHPTLKEERGQPVETPNNTSAKPSATVTSNTPIPPTKPATTSSPRSSSSLTVPLATRTRFVPVELPENVVQGASAYYQGIPIDVVAQMESCGNQTDKVLLTFDDFGSNEHIRAIAKELKQNGTGAIFFLNTSKVDPAIITELRQQGFWVGNHTATHPDLTKLSDADITAAIQSGGPADLFRPPYGATWVNKADSNRIYFQTRVLNLAQAAGKRICMWSVDTKDWAKGATASGIVKTVSNEARPGSVVLMHAVDSYPTLQALPEVIAAIQKLGLKTCALSPAPTTETIPASVPC